MKKKEISNCIAHVIFFNKYLNLGFKVNEFVGNYNEDVSCINRFAPLLNSYRKKDCDLNKTFVECYISFKTDFNQYRTKMNKDRLKQLKQTDDTLYNLLENFIIKIEAETDCNKIEDIIKEFYKEADKLC